MSKTWLIGDTHFNHSAIIEYTDRPFVDVEQMNQTIIENWNKQIKSNDVIIHLGDFAMGSKAEQEAILKQLNGIKKLIMGNHDRLKVRDYYEMGFAEVYRYPIIIENMIFSHRPLDSLIVGSLYNVHGHIHEKCSPSANHLNISVEHTNYSPISLNWVKKKLVG